jgi:predicted amidohydrolase
LGRPCALIVGHIARNPGNQGRAIQNVVSVLEGGREVFRQAKTLLPTYDIFDEARLFEPASEIKLWDCDGVPIALAICEDLWGADPQLGRRFYGRDPVADYQRLGARLICSVSASPYEQKKRPRREAIHAEVARRVGVPLVYVNSFGATDEVLFDGASFALTREGQVLGRLVSFEGAHGLLDWNPGTAHLNWEEPGSLQREDSPVAEIEILRRALVCGIREYFKRTGFKDAILGPWWRPSRFRRLGGRMCGGWRCRVSTPRAIVWRTLKNWPTIWGFACRLNRSNSYLRRLSGRLPTE